MWTSILTIMVLTTSPDVEVVQGGWKTRGTVVHASREYGTWILTCGHKHQNPDHTWAYRAVGDRTSAGTVVRVCPRTDLALIVRQYSPGQQERPLATQGSVDGLNGRPPDGSSGGAIVDKHGRIVGIVSGYDGWFGRTVCVPRTQIERFLRSQ